MAKRLTGGTAGEQMDSFGVPFFQPGVKAVQLSTKNTYSIRFLPAFDETRNPDDPAYKLAFVPYRNADELDTETGRHKFTPWYFQVRVHDYIGNGGRSFISPASGQQPGKGIDPLTDCYFAAKNHSRPEWQELIDKEANQEEGRGKFAKAVLPSSKTKYFANVMMKFGETWENRIIVFGFGTFGDLKAKLNWRRGATDPAISPEWSDYLYGDITHPTQGLVCMSKIGATNSSGKAAFESNIFNFSSVPQMLTGATQLPFDPATPMGQSALMGRYDISDDRVTKISTAEEILDYMVHDGFLPYELIQEACGGSWDVPAEKPKSKHFPGNTPPAEVVDAAADNSGGGRVGRRAAAPAAPAPVGVPIMAPSAQAVGVPVAGTPAPAGVDFRAHMAAAPLPQATPVGTTPPAPPAPPRPPAPPAPPAPPLAPKVEPPKPERRFWAMEKDSPDPVFKTEAQVILQIRKDGPNIDVMLDGDTNWKKPAAYGLTAPAAEQSGLAPKLPSGTPAPVAVQPPQQAAPPSELPVAGGPLNPAERAEFTALEKRIQEVGPNGLAPAEFTRFGELCARADLT